MDTAARVNAVQGNQHVQRKLSYLPISLQGFHGGEWHDYLFTDSTARSLDASHHPICCHALPQASPRRMLRLDTSSSL